MFLFIAFQPIQYREDVPDKSQRISNLSVMIPSPKAEEILKEALLLESGRFVARDIGMFFFRLLFLFLHNFLSKP